MKGFFSSNQSEEFLFFWEYHSQAARSAKHAPIQYLGDGVRLSNHERTAYKIAIRQFQGDHVNS